MVRVYRAAGAALVAMLLAAAPISGCTPSGPDESSVDVGSYDPVAAQKALEEHEARMKQYSERSREERSYDSPVLVERTDGKPLSEGTPFIDLDASLVDQTGLGAHDEEGSVVDGGVNDDGVPYYWHAKNGTGDLLFSVVVRDGRVIDANRFNGGRDYWSLPGGSSGRDLPDPYASGSMVARSGAAAPDDPTDYATPDDYADNNESAFSGDGASDAWQKAYDYWCDHHGAQD